MTGSDKTKLDGIASGANVVGAASSTDNAIARFDSTTGKVIQNSAVTIDDSGNISVGGSATVDGRDVSADGTTLDAISKGVVSKTTQSGTSYTLALADMGTVIDCSNASAKTITVPANATTAFTIGCTINLYQSGAGQITVAAAGGVTIRTAQTLKARAQYSMIVLYKLDTNEWLLTGDMEAA